jgi:hypothetical protein
MVNAPPAGTPRPRIIDDQQVFTNTDLKALTVAQRKKGRKRVTAEYQEDGGTVG